MKSIVLIAALVAVPLVAQPITTKRPRIALGHKPPAALVKQKCVNGRTEFNVETNPFDEAHPVLRFVCPKPKVAKKK